MLVDAALTTVFDSKCDIVKRGVFQENELIEELNAPGKYPGCSGTRLLQDNLSDLKAQIGTVMET